MGSWPSRQQNANPLDNGFLSDADAKYGSDADGEDAEDEQFSFRDRMGDDFINPLVFDENEVFSPSGSEHKTLDSDLTDDSHSKGSFVESPIRYKKKEALLDSASYASFVEFVKEYTKFFDIADMLEEEEIDPEAIQEAIPHVSNIKVEQSRARVRKVRRTEDNKYLFDNKTKHPSAELISLYTTNSGIYKPLNKALRDRKKLAKTDYDRYAKNLVKALLFLPRCSVPVLYRGQTYLGDQSDYEEGNLIGYNNFISTSFDKKAALEFAGKGMIFRIKAATGRDISSLSHIKHEKEVVLLPGCVFRVLSCTTETFDDIVPERELFVVELEEQYFGFGKRIVLWVDDDPKGNVQLINYMEQYGTRPICVKSTADAIRWLDDPRNKPVLDKPFSQFRIISDMRREEGGVFNNTAGMQFIKQLRNVRIYHQPILLYVRNVKQAKKILDEQNLNDVTVTDDWDLALDYGAFLCDLRDLNNQSTYETGNVMW